MYRLLIGMVGLAALVCASATTYEESIRAWQEHRNAGLRKPDSWLTLVGLFWLKPGDNTIGSAPTSNFVLPKSSAPEHAGVFHLAGDAVTYNGHPVSIDEDSPEVFHAGSTSFFVIKRGDRYAVRAKDSASPVLRDFTGAKFFPIRPELHFRAKFIADPKKMPILNVLGETEPQDSPGFVEFTYAGQAYHLRPIYEGQTLFFLFKDKTNHAQTYQAGRMLNTPLPANGVVDLDFNRSYNPPCIFTPYATCPLAPKENTLPFAVEAGELRYGGGHPGA